MPHSSQVMHATDDINLYTDRMFYTLLATAHQSRERQGPLAACVCLTGSCAQSGTSLDSWTIQLLILSRRLLSTENTQMLKVNGVQHSAMFCSDANTPSKVKKEESLPFLTPLKMKAQTKQPKLSIYLIIIICLLSSLFVHFNSFSKCFLWTIIKLSIS